MEPTEYTKCLQINEAGQVCNLPAEILARTALASTAGPVEHLTTRCIVQHFLVFPGEMLGAAA